MNFLREVNALYDNLNRKVITKTSERDQLQKKAEELNQKIASIDIESLEKANLILQKMGEKQRQSACTKLQNLCTYALQYSLSPNYEMIIEISKARGKPSAEIYIRKNDTGIVTTPMDGNGGGVIDIIGMAIRCVVMQTHEPFIDGPIILDEPYKMVSEEFVPAISNFIKNLSTDFGRQVILCTHNKYLAQIADKQIFVSMGDNNESVVEEK